MKGQIFDKDSISTLPDEVRSISAVVRNANCVLSATGKNGIEYSNRIDGTSVPVYNKLTKILLSFIDNSPKHFVITEDNIKDKISDQVLQYDNPDYGDKNFHTIVKSNSDTYVEIFPVYTYFIFRSITDGVVTEYYSKDGIKWISDLTEILSGYRPIHDGKLCGLTERCAYILSNNTLYEWDFINRCVTENSKYFDVFNRDHLSNDMIFASTKNINFSIQSKCIDNTWNIYYANTNNSIAYDHFKITDLYLNDNETIIWCDAVQTHRNTLCIMGYIETADSNIEIVICELIMQYDNSENLGTKLLYHIKRTGISYDAKVNDIFYRPSLVENNSLYFLSTISNIYFSEDTVKWISIDTFNITNFSEKFISRIYGLENDILVYNDYGGKEQFIISEINLLTSRDLPMDVSYINYHGNLRYGKASDNEFSMMSMGRIVNNSITDHSTFNNIALFDNDEYHMSQIIYRENWFYFFILDANLLKVYRSTDGSNWEDCTTIDMNNFRVFVAANPYHSRWAIKEINGLLYIIRPGVICDTVIRLKFENGMVYGESTNTPFTNGGVIWANDVYDMKNIRYICSSCIGEICAYIENNDIKKLILGTSHDFKVIDEDVTSGLNFMSYVTNELHGAILFDNEKYVYISDGTVYYSTSKLSNQEYLNSSKFVDFFRYDDYIIMIKDNFTNNDNFIIIMKLDHSNNTINEVPNNKLREIFNKLRGMKYSPIATLHENLLCVEDYQNQGFSFTIDLDNDFDIVYINDKENTDHIKFIQYCNGIIFRLQFTDKHTAIGLSKMPIKSNWIDSTYSDGKYLAINDNDFFIYYSEDGVNWHTGTEYGEMQMSNIIANEEVVLLYNKESTNDICYISYDRGETWHIVQYMTNIQNVEVLDDQFVLFIGNSNDGRKYNDVYITTNNFIDLKKYSTNIIGSSVLKRSYRDITQNEDGLWVAISGDGVEVVYSLDGETWKETRLPRNQSWTCVNYGNGYFVAFAKDTMYGAYSENGIDWYDIVLPEKCTISACAFVPALHPYENLFVAVGTNQQGYYFKTDTTPTNVFHSSRIPTSNVNWSRMIYQDNKLVVVAPNINYVMYTTSFDDTWHRATLPYFANWHYFLYASGIFLLIDKDKKYACSSYNGINWIDNKDYVLADSGQSLRVVHYTDEYFTVFILGDNEYNPDDSIDFESVSIEDEWIDITKNGFKTILISKNGVIMEKDNDSDIWYGIHLNEKDLQYEAYDTPYCKYHFYVNDHQFMLAFGNKIRMKVDDTWKDCNIKYDDSNLAFNPSMVYYDNKYFLLINTSAYFWSNDGLTWFKVNLETSRRITKLRVVNDHFIMIGTYLYLYDGIGNRLIELNINDDVQFTSIDYNGSVYIAVGNPVDSTSTSRYVAISTDFDSWIVKDIVPELNLEIDQYENLVEDVKSQDNYWYILITDINKLAYSTDNCETWNLLILNDSVGKREYNPELVKLGDKFCAIIKKDTNSILYGSGIIWATLPSIDVWNNRINTMLFDGVHYMISYNDRYAYSYDMINWYRPYQLSEVLYGNGVFVAFDTTKSADIKTNFFYSYDGITWDRTSYEFGNNIRDMEYGDGKFIAIVDNEDTKYFVSTNILDWETEFIYRLSYKNNICYGYEGFIVTQNNSEYSFLIRNRLGTEVSKLQNPVTYVDVSYGNLTYAAIQSGNNTVSLFDDKYNHRFDIVIPESVQSNIYDKIEFICGRFYIYSNSLSTIYVLEANGIYSETNLKKYQLHDNVKEVSTGINNLPMVLYSSGTIFCIIDVDAGEYEEYELKTAVNDVCIYNGIIYGIDDSTVYIFDDQGNIRESYNTGYDDLQSIITGNGILVITRNFMNRYLVNVGNNITKWEIHEMINQMSISNLSYTKGYFIAELYSDRPYLAFSKDCNSWFIKDIDVWYNTINLCSTNGTIWLLDGSDSIDILKLKDHILLLTASGFVVSDLDIKSPQKPTMAKGSFEYNSVNNDQFIQLDFYPKKVFIRSRSYVDGNIYQTIISNTNDLYQNLNNEINTCQNTIELEFKSSNSSLNNKDVMSRITMNGFIVNLPATGIYDYYAIS